MSIPVFKLKFTDFRKVVSELIKPVDNNNSLILERMYWFETPESIWIYFDKYYTQIQKAIIEELKEFDHDIDIFKQNFLSTAVELEVNAPELKRIETLLDHFHYYHTHTYALPVYDEELGLNPDKEPRIVQTLENN